MNFGMLLFLLLFGCGCAAIAYHKGRSVIGWFFAGCFFSWIALIIIACLSNLKEAQARERRQQEENRRLREQLRQEKLKQEAFRRHAAARLDIHDGALNMDTRGAAAPELGAPESQAPSLPPPLPAPETAPAADPETSYAAWYYERQGETYGPVQQQFLAKLFSGKQLPANTLVCREDQGEWTPAHKVPAFRRALAP